MCIVRSTATCRAVSRTLVHRILACICEENAIPPPTHTSHPLAPTHSIRPPSLLYIYAHTISTVDGAPFQRARADRDAAINADFHAQHLHAVAVSQRLAAVNSSTTGGRGGDGGGGASSRSPVGGATTVGTWAQLPSQIPLNYQQQQQQQAAVCGERDYSSPSYGGGGGGIVTAQSRRSVSASPAPSPISNNTGGEGGHRRFRSMKVRGARDGI